MKKLLPALFICLGINILLAQKPMVNFPAISPDGNFLAFNYQGDIWVSDINGKGAKRLTIHEAYDTKPMWSADGKSIAFQSNRFGNGDIYVISALGGRSKRITYRSSNDVLTDFGKNNELIFETNREHKQIEWENEFQTVSSEGGTPSLLMNSFGYDAKMSPDGNFIVFVKGVCRIEREAYKGPANKNIWLYDIKNDSYKQLTTYEGNDFYPHWGKSNTIFFQSSRSGKYNVHQLKLDEKGNKVGDITQITNFSKMGIFSFNVNPYTNNLVVAVEDKVFKVDPVSKAATEIKIDLRVDYRLDPTVQRTYTNSAGEIAVSPNGKLTALVIRGEIFIKQNEKDKSRMVNISNSAYRDRMINWLNDETILFISDRDGQNDLYVVTSNDPSEKNLFKTLKYTVKRLTSTQEEESNPVISPDRKSIVYQRGRGTLLRASIDEKGKLSSTKVLHDSWNVPSNVSWSPDSKWLAYNLTDLNFNNEIYIHKADDSQKPVNISLHPKQDVNPIWSKDGKKLVFSSNRNNSDYDVWFTWLKKSDWEKTQRDWEEEVDTSANTPKKENDKTVVKDIVIDFDNIYKRQQQVTSFTGGEFASAITNDGKTIYYTTGNGSRGNADTKSDLFKIDWDGKNLKALTSNNTRPSSITLQEKHLYFTKGRGNLARINTANDKTENLPFSARMIIDYEEESNQIFEEAWKAINDGFYDPNFHGQNWKNLKANYKPMALKASTRIDFQTIFNRMLGQINASHMGLRVAENRLDVQREVTGLVGVNVTPLANGTLKVNSIVPGMPADRSASKLLTGDIITAVNGNKLDKNSNFYSFLNGTANEKIYLQIKRKNETREIIIRPKSGDRFEDYNAWVEERKRLTDIYSKGRLGYIHIQGMNWPSFERFERELAAAGNGKEGIVIDVRFNGGGWTTDYLMAVLNVKQHAYTVPRGAAKNLQADHPKFKDYYPYSERLPLSAWTKPSIAMSNQASYSNAEIFSHAYKALGIGKLVGESTFGAVISTGGRRLIDGSTVRMPFRGWYVKTTRSNMELGPAVPDIQIKNAPDDKAKGKDTQLKRAVEELLSALGK